MGGARRSDGRPQACEAAAGDDDVLDHGIPLLGCRWLHSGARLASCIDPVLLQTIDPLPMTEAPSTRSSRAALALGEPAAGETLQRWLYRSLRQAILDGRLREGALLPGTRALAQQYAMARGTVQLAYDQLLSEGYLQA